MCCKDTIGSRCHHRAGFQMPGHYICVTLPFFALWHYLAYRIRRLTSEDTMLSTNPPARLTRCPPMITANHACFPPSGLYPPQLFELQGAKQLPTTPRLSILSIRHDYHPRKHGNPSYAAKGRHCHMPVLLLSPVPYILQHVSGCGKRRKIRPWCMEKSGHGQGVRQVSGRHHGLHHGHQDPSGKQLSHENRRLTP